MRQRSRPAAVEVGEAKAFVDAMEAIDGFRRLERDWSGPGARAPSARAVSTASLLMKQRQAMASRLKVVAGTDGDVRIRFRCGETGTGEQGLVHIDRDGRPAIVAGDVDEATAERHAGANAKDFRKALDALISPRAGRYGVKRVEVDGIMFDPAIEGRRFRILKGDEALGLIADLRMQVAYPYEENGRHCFTYKSDFNYVLVATGEEVVEDVKGMKTDVYKLKKKLVEARYGIVISEWPVTKKEAERRLKAAERQRLADEKEARRLQRAARAEERRAAAAAKPARRAGGAKGGGTVAAVPGVGENG